jgi:CRP-like cAMP-binding protein
MTDSRSDRGPLLRILDEENPKTVSENSRVRHLGRREFVFMEGQEATHYAVVLHGRVKLVSTSEAGKETILDFVEPGEIVCPHATITGAPYCCSAVTDHEHTDVLLLKSDVVDQAVIRELPVVGSLVRQMAQRGSTMCRRVGEVTAGRVEQRLARVLLRLSDDRQDTEVDGTQSFREVRLTRQDLADLCGTSAETVTRILKRMEKQGWVALGRGLVAVLDAEGLSECVAGESGQS